MQVPIVECPQNINSLQNICYRVFLDLRSEIVDMILSFREKLLCSIKYEVCCVVLVSV